MATYPHMGWLPFSSLPMFAFKNWKQELLLAVPQGVCMAFLADLAALGHVRFTEISGEILYNILFFWTLAYLYEWLIRLVKPEPVWLPATIFRFGFGLLLYVFLGFCWMHLLAVLMFLVANPAQPIEWKDTPTLRVIYSIYLIFMSLLFILRTGIRLLLAFHQQKMYSEQLQKEIAQARFEALKKQINPHFLFNSLNMIVSMVRVEPELAEQFTQQLARVYRYLLENEEATLVPLQAELDHLRAYLFLLEIRFRDKLRFEWQLPDPLPKGQLPKFALQLLAENAVKHNRFSKAAPLELVVYAENGHIVLRNPFRPKEVSWPSTGIGQETLLRQYHFLGQPTPSFEEKNEYYYAKLPLIHD